MTSEITVGLILGIVSGLISSFIILFFRSYWQNTLIPWYEERIYKDAHVEGKWNGKIHLSDTDISDYVFHLKRQSHQVTGEMISKRSGNKYELMGEFRNMIMTLTYSSTVPHAVDRGCFTFLLIKNGIELNGQGAFYYSPGHVINTASVILSRDTEISTDHQLLTELEE